MTTSEWNALPALLDVHHIARIYGRKVGGVRKAWQERSDKLPTPCQSRPYKVRREDARRHFERMSA